MSESFADFDDLKMYGWKKEKQHSHGKILFDFWPFPSELKFKFHSNPVKI